MFVTSGSASKRTVLFIRAKVRELNHEVSKKNSFIDEMELKYNGSSECGPSHGLVHLFCSALT